MRYLALFHLPAFFVLNSANLRRFAAEVFPDVTGNKEADVPYAARLSFSCSQMVVRRYGPSRPPHRTFRRPHPASIRRSKAGCARAYGGVLWAAAFVMTGRQSVLGADGKDLGQAHEYRVSSCELLGESVC